MIKINEDERREFFRIDDEIYLNYELISEEQYKQSAKILADTLENTFNLSANFATLNSNNMPVLNNIKHLHPDIGSYLETINNKLDSLSQQMLCNNPEFDIKNKISVNISASGIQFETQEKLELQQAVKLKLILLPEKIGVLIFGRIIDIKKENISIEFEFIRNEDQELMIRHNLNKQLAELRDKNDNN